MTPDRIAALEALLVETQAAHGVYEASELAGVYDEAWPHWYAEYAIDHGIAKLIGRAITTDELAGLVAGWWAEDQDAGAGAQGPWAAATARRLATEPATGGIEP
jgi:hypothetical protein